jgi:chromosome segregation ATPase
MAEHEKELTAQSLGLLQQEHESLVAQQGHWDDLRRVSEQIEALTTFRSQADEDEVRELKRARDQHRQLESEYSALQKRARDQELRAANNERAANAAKQNLIQAQQRASEWERRAREYESDLEMTKNKLDEVEQEHAQLDADYSLVNLQLEEKEAEDRLVKVLSMLLYESENGLANTIPPSQDRENKLRDQASSLESQLARLEAELSKAKAQAHPAVINMPSYGKATPTKNTSPPRPDSRASTVFGADRSRTPVGRVNGTLAARSNTPPQSSVWDSIHAPQQRYPNLGSTTSQRRVAPTPSYRSQSVASTYTRAQSVASPTPSTVSVTPTVDENGWWS